MQRWAAPLCLPQACWACSGRTASTHRTSSSRPGPSSQGARPQSPPRPNAKARRGECGAARCRQRRATGCNKGLLLQRPTVSRTALQRRAARCGASRRVATLRKTLQRRPACCNHPRCCMVPRAVAWYRGLLQRTAGCCILMRAVARYRGLLQGTAGCCKVPRAAQRGGGGRAPARAARVH